MGRIFAARAVSDLSGTIVGQTDVIHSRNPQKTAERIAELVKATGAEQLVMGFPRNMDGSEGPRAALYRDFAALVEHTVGMPVALWDERRTTVQAEHYLNEMNVRGKRRKEVIDKRAHESRSQSGRLYREDQVGHQQTERHTEKTPRCQQGRETGLALQDGARGRNKVDI